MKYRYIVVCFLIIIALFSGCVKKQEQNENTNKNQGEIIVSGKVFLDQNSNGIFDKEEKGIARIKIIGDNNTAFAVTDEEGSYNIKLKNSPLEIMVDMSTVLSDYILTTNNSKQTITPNKDSYVATPIGYVKKTIAKEISFEESYSDKKNYDNYYFDLIISTNGAGESSNKLWVIGSSFKSETQGTITFVNQKNKNMGVYIQAQNQVIITPLQEMEKLTTPFTVIDDIPKEVLSKMNYKGKEKLDEKSVLIFESSSSEIYVKLYIWEEEGIIIKMETKKGQHTDSYYFKDFKLNSVKETDITYPSGANVMDLTAY